LARRKPAVCFMGGSKRHIQPERYAKCPHKFMKQPPSVAVKKNISWCVLFYTFCEQPKNLEILTFSKNSLDLSGKLWYILSSIGGRFA
jgi:hypothetical protein